MPQTWLDNTGLYQKYGVDQTVTTNTGEYKTYGELREIEAVINLSAAAYPFGVATILADNVFIPAGVRIQEVETYTETATAGGGTLSLGLIRTDRTTVLSATSLMNAVTPGAAGTKLVNSTPSANGIGVTTANVYHLLVTVNTANYTAGVIKVRIRYYKP